MIRVENLSKSFRGAHGTIPALENVQLTIEAGEIFGIAGYSGAGKSTLLRCLNRLEEADTGTIIVDGRDLRLLNRKELAEARRSIGMIFQHFNLLDSRDVAGNIALPLEMAGYPAQERQKRVHELAELVGLRDKLRARPSQLSGGQKQRVGIARALALNPRVLLCDEATSALDPPTALQILDLLVDLNRRLGLTVVLVTHQLEIIRSFCPRMALLDQGRVVELGSTLDILRSPQSELGRKFLEVGQRLFVKTEGQS